MVYDFDVTYVILRVNGKILVFDFNPFIVYVVLSNGGLVGVKRWR